jgi:hypothetical protein
MPIFVETFIRSSIDEVWRRTQDPDLHQRWDVRFSSIEYLPSEDASPQRFLYLTRIGFGVEIAGEGESVGEHDARDGSRTSVLRFWSDDRKSLIAKGGGYWKYIPTADGVRFLTVYDYDTRFSFGGALVDRLFFRPLMAWATAWSFDRLRLWIEEGTPPEDSRRFAITAGLSRLTLAAIWIYQGLVPKILVADSGELALTAAVVGAARAPVVLQCLAAVEIMTGVALLAFRRSRMLVLLSSAALCLMTAIGIARDASIATAPFNAVSLTVAMLALAATLLNTMPAAPLASRTRWSWRKRST